MNYKIKNLIFFIFFLCFLNFSSSNAGILKKIIVNGNDRITDETIILFSNVSLNENLNKKILILF